MDKFEAALAFTLPHEGGYVNDPDDPGGATNYGISLRFLHTLDDEDLALYDIDLDGDVDRDDIAAMSEALAKETYRLHFWTPRFEEIHDVVVSIKMFDMSVNMGHRRANKILQSALSWWRPDIAIDGIFGSQTAGMLEVRVKDLNRDAFRQALVAEQAKFYFDLVDAKPVRGKFLLGWLRRAYALPEEIHV